MKVTLPVILAWVLCCCVSCVGDAEKPISGFPVLQIQVLSRGHTCELWVNGEPVAWCSAATRPGARGLTVGGYPIRSGTNELSVISTFLPDSEGVKRRLNNIFLLAYTQRSQDGRVDPARWEKIDEYSEWPSTNTCVWASSFEVEEEYVVAQYDVLGDAAEKYSKEAISLASKLLQLIRSGQAEHFAKALGMPNKATLLSEQLFAPLFSNEIVARSDSDNVELTAKCGRCVILIHARSDEHLLTQRIREASGTTNLSLDSLRFVRENGRWVLMIASSRPFHVDTDYLDKALEK